MTAALSVLQEIFKLDSFRPGQEQVISTLLAGRSALAVFPTGGGKSLCYQLPALLLDGLTVVISPLIALMKDQVDSLQSLGIQAARLDSSLTSNEIKDLWFSISNGQCKILYVSPERLQNERFVQRLTKVNISLLAVDEAHCISEWGHNFRPDYLKLGTIAKSLNVGRILALTATATPSVSHDICTQFEIGLKDHVQTGFARPNLSVCITSCSPKNRTSKLISAIQKLPSSELSIPSVVVYVTLQHTAEEVAKDLKSAGINATYYHAGMKSEDRNKIQNQFMSSDVQVVVATIAFGMGIDKSDIRAVFHFNLPKSIENYVQEIGRAGRDGRASHCEMFASYEDRRVLSNFSYGDTPASESLLAFLEYIFLQPAEFDVSKYSLSKLFDIRMLVLNTAFTYLELEGIITAITPFYDTQKISFIKPKEDILSSFDHERSAFLNSIFNLGKSGRTWLSIGLTDISQSLNEDRTRISKALNYLEEQGMIELQVSNIRQSYRKLKKVDVNRLMVRFNDLFTKREELDIQRLDQVIQLANNTSCISNQLTRYFGEQSSHPCGLCSHCRGYESNCLSTTEDNIKLNSHDIALIREVQSENHDHLKTSRQLARFLCGLNSPATSQWVEKKRLKNHRLFGCLENKSFMQVLMACT